MERIDSLVQHLQTLRSGGVISGKSGIHIKKENRGKFTRSAKAAGRSVQEHARAVLNDPNATPLQKKRANFARNAAKWHHKHQEGGNISNPRKDYYIQSLDNFIKANPTINGLDTAKFRDFFIEAVGKESGWNPSARQGSFYGWYQMKNGNGSEESQHKNAYVHLARLFNNIITKADVEKARELGISDAALLLKYWNQENRVNNYLWNNKDSLDGLGTSISNYGNDLTSSIDIYDNALDNLYGDYIVKSGDNQWDLQKRIRFDGRDYSMAGRDLDYLFNGNLKIGKTINIPEKPIINRSELGPVRSNPIQLWWNPKYQSGGSLVYSAFTPNKLKSKKEEPTETIIKEDYSNPEFPIESVKPWTTSAIENTYIPQVQQKPRGITQFKNNNIDVGNFREFLDKVEEAGISLRITSGKESRKTKSGKTSLHTIGNAIDVTPVDGDWNKLIAQFKDNPELIDYMARNGIGVIDETDPAMMARTGATGKHFHFEIVSPEEREKGRGKISLYGFNKLFG